MFRDPSAKAQIALRKAFLRMLTVATNRVASQLDASGVLDEPAFRVVSTFMPKEIGKTFLEPTEDYDESVPFERALIHAAANSGIAIEDAAALAKEMAAAQRDIRQGEAISHLRELDERTRPPGRLINGHSDPVR